MLIMWHLTIFVFIVSLNPYVTSLYSDDDCVFHDLTPSVASVVCAVERKVWILPLNSSAIMNAGCLLGANRCSAKRHVPTQNEVPPSSLPPEAKNKQYQALAMTAESIVPKTWWREGFANEQLLLTSNDKDLPRKQFDASRLRNKKLKNLLQCVTRQQFIRKSFDFNHDSEGDSVISSKCSAMSDPVVISFLEQWNTGDSSTTFGGELRKEIGSDKFIWAPKEGGDGKLLVSALQVSLERKQREL